MSNTNVDILLLRDLESRDESVVRVVGGEDGEGGEDLQQRGGQRGGGPGPGPSVAATSRNMIILILKYSKPHPLLCATLLINQLTEAQDPCNKKQTESFYYW